MHNRMYISISEEDKIAVFDVDATTGRTTHFGDVPTSGRPAPLAVDPERKYLYVGCRATNELMTFRIDPGEGSLSPIGKIPLESDPCFLSTDRTGKFLLSAYYGAGAAAVHRIGSDGVAISPPVQWLPTAPGAHSIHTDRSNRFAFVPHIAGGTGPNAIFQFNFDEGSGELTPNSPARVTPDNEAGPRHYCYHPTKDMAYFSNEQGSSVTAYDLNPREGTLTAKQTISTLPNGYTGENTCAQIQIAPSGKFLYAPNRGHNSIACYSIDETSGMLTSIGNLMTEPVPRALSLDPTGAFLYVAGLESGNLASYSIDSDSGTLHPLEVQPIGAGPMWVLIFAAT
jgi:6-phosphogluconolactonase